MDSIKMFQSESNLGLLWGLESIRTLGGSTVGFNPNQISAYYGGILCAAMQREMVVSIRIKSRLIMGEHAVRTFRINK